jgi:hypothetical protein
VVTAEAGGEPAPKALPPGVPLTRQKGTGPCLDSVFVWPDPGNLEFSLFPGIWLNSLGCARAPNAAAAPVFKSGCLDLVLKQAVVAPNRASNAQCVLLLRLLSQADEPKTDQNRAPEKRFRFP